MHNNLFSGAQLLVFGNFVAMYRHVLLVALGEGTPLFQRDVIKVDQQDDNAAIRLFSTTTLQYLIEHHPECMDEIVYLFVFSELVDAYQNWRLPHSEPVLFCAPRLPIGTDRIPSRHPISTRIPSGF